MLKYRLNKNRIEEEMVKKGLNLTGLARLLGFSLQLTHYALNHGGSSFALKISRTLGIEPGEILVSINHKRRAKASSRGVAGGDRKPAGA